MVPMQSTDLTPEIRQTLLDVAMQSIQHGLSQGNPVVVTPGDYPELLQLPGASFVTLNKHGKLRGCIGSLEAHQPLIQDVAEHAFDAAYRDPRFPPLSEHEVAQLDIHISILTPPEPMEFDSEADLLKQIQPGEDGLILEYAYHRGTFLPSVWDSLPEKQQFLQQLKRKAGLPAAFWDTGIRVSRYHALMVE